MHLGLPVLLWSQEKSFFHFPLHSHTDKHKTLVIHLFGGKERSNTIEVFNWVYKIEFKMTSKPKSISRRWYKWRQEFLHWSVLSCPNSNLLLVPAWKPLPSGGLVFIPNSFSIAEGSVCCCYQVGILRHTFQVVLVCSCVVVVQQVANTFLQALLLKIFPPT